jgi:Ferritin-like
MRYRQPNNPKRQKLIRDDHGRSVPRGAPTIKTIEDLRKKIQDAIALEHFTIPPYLCALYSIKLENGNSNHKAFQIIHSVVMEEMLHMIMAANLLTAIGGTPCICKRKFLPTYPKKMPYSAIGFEVNLLKFSKEAVNTFLRIERPAERTDSAPRKNFWSICEFYEAVREALHRLDTKARKRSPKGIFTGDKSLQVKNKYFGGGGRIVEVYNLENADEAINEIVGQGEGIDGTIDDGDDTMFGQGMELAHYFRFNEIFCERRYQAGDKPNDAPSGERLKVDWDAVHNMVPNPSMAMFKKNNLVLEPLRDFNRNYTKLLQLIEKACTKDPEILTQNFNNLMRALANQAPELMQIESGIGDYTAGPSFEYIP